MKNLVFPNPSGDLFHLSIPPNNIKSVSLLTINGHEIKTYNHQSIDNNNYSLSYIKNGIYLIKIDVEEDNYYTYLIVNN
ncbi:MAG: T9SS type A sorting domain-containing protein [Flavobacteriales bacterium]|nr:T9SS type A sorting domain-containing protein [Flavobacteriales bacterium]